MYCYYNSKEQFTLSTTHEHADRRWEIHNGRKYFVSSLLGSYHIALFDHLPIEVFTYSDDFPGAAFRFLTGMVDQRTMEKYEKEAKEVGRESWYLSWALDTNKEERAKVRKRKDVDVTDC
jgi:hypothetical protein